MTHKNRIFSLIEMMIECINFVGLKKACFVLYYYIRTKFFSKDIKNTYQFFGFKIFFLNKMYLPDIIFEQFGLNIYFFKSKDTQPVILDIGANIGDTVLYFKWLYPKSKIYAFEPHPLAYELLTKNIEINHLKNVRTYNEALGNRKGTIELKSDDSEMFYSSSITEKSFDSRNISLSNKIKVKINKISSHIEIIKLKKIDLLKIDIEGAEKEVFQDIDFILDKTQKVILEYHLMPDVKDNSLDFILSKLQKNNFEISFKSFYRQDFNMTNPHVSIILANKKNV